jgi:hypothetical protein
MSVGIHGNVGRLVGLLCLALVIGTVCRGQDVKYNFMPGTDFSKYHTYKWVAIEGASHPNQSWTLKSSRPLTRNWLPRV